MRNKREKIYTVGNNKYGIPELTGIKESEDKKNNPQEHSTCW